MPLENASAGSNKQRVLLKRLIKFVWIFVGVILIWLIVPKFSGIKLHAKQTQLMSDAKGIVLCCKQFALEHHGQWPTTLPELAPRYVTREGLEATLALWKSEGSFEYLGHRDSEPDSQPVLMVANTKTLGAKIVVRADDSAAVEKLNP